MIYTWKIEEDCVHVCIVTPTHLLIITYYIANCRINLIIAYTTLCVLANVYGVS